MYYIETHTLFYLGDKLISICAPSDIFDFSDLQCHCALRHFNIQCQHTTRLAGWAPLL